MDRQEKSVAFRMALTYGFGKRGLATNVGMRPEREVANILADAVRNMCRALL